MKSSRHIRIIWILLILFTCINGCKKSKKYFLKPIEDKDIEMLMENVNPDNGEEDGDNEVEGDETEGESDGEEAEVEIVKYTITIYVDQPGTGGDRDVKEGEFFIDPGHAFIKLETEDANGDKNDLIFGFYAVGNANEQTREADGRVSDDTPKAVRNEYEVSKTFVVTKENFIKAKNYIESIRSSKKKYHLDDYNCADFVIQTARAAEINVPDTTAPYTIKRPFKPDFTGRCSNPGNLGEDLRAMPD